MKTHDLARALNTLARSFRDSENAELSSVVVQPINETAQSKSLGANAPAALALLVRLAAYSKAEWKSLIDELELNVPVKPTDSVRDIIGRLFRDLNDNRDIQDKLVEKAKKPQANVSPELMKALSILMSK